MALTTPLVMTSVTFMADRERSDQLVYGRYVDAIVWPLVAHRGGRRRQRPRRPGQRRTRVDTVILSATAITCGTFGLIVAWRHGDQLAGDVGLRMMVPGLLPHIGGADGVPVLRITATTIAVLVAMILAMRRRLGRTTITWIVVVSICGVAWAGMRVHDAQAQALNTWAIGDEVAPHRRDRARWRAIGVLFVPDDDRPRVPYAIQRQRAQVYQLYPVRP
jgi:drug/metabolite transporter (DMT)-like permease